MVAQVTSVNDVAVVRERPSGWVQVSRPERTTSKALLVSCEGTRLWLPKRNCRIYAGSYYATRPAITAARDWVAKNPGRT